MDENHMYGGPITICFCTQIKLARYKSIGITNVFTI